MKLISYIHENSEGIGAVIENGVVTLNEFAPSMIHLIENWDALSDRVAEKIERDSSRIGLNEVRLRAPIPRPGKILAIGLNYKDHIAESGLPTPEHQLWFGKQATSVNGPLACPIRVVRWIR